MFRPIVTITACPRRLTPAGFLGFEWFWSCDSSTQFVYEHGERGHDPMKKATIEHLENTPIASSVEKMLTEPLDLSNVAINYFELEPGDSFTGGLHTHTNQEEVFYIAAGEVTFQTLDGQVPVAANEVIRFAPGEYHMGRNEHDRLVRALAVGAPRNPGETRLRMPCEECDDSEYHVVDLADGRADITCPSCGHVVAVELDGVRAEQ